MLCTPIYLQFDTTLGRTLDNIVTLEGPGFDDLQWRLAILPIRSCGLGLYTTGDARLFSFVTSRIKSIDLENHILLECCDVVPLGDHFD